MRKRDIRCLVRNTHSVNAEFPPLPFGAGGSQVRPAMFFGPADNGGTNARSPFCPSFCSIPTIQRHQVNEGFSDMDCLGPRHGPTETFSVPWFESDQHKPRAKLRNPEMRGVDALTNTETLEVEVEFGGELFNFGGRKNLA